MTAYDDGRPIKCDDSIEGKRNRSSHVGGVADGDVMAATMELDRDGLHALKSVFFFPGCVVALGTDIRVSRMDFTAVTTAIDQVHLSGEMTSGKNWIHHDGRGYVSLDGAPILASDDMQRGDWEAIDPALKGKEDSCRVFKCWFDHPVMELEEGHSGSYAYALVPCSTAGETAAFAGKVSKGGSSAPVVVLRNDPACQAVRYGDIECAILHEPGACGSGDVPSGIGPSIVIRRGDGVPVVSYLVRQP